MEFQRQQKITNPNLQLSIIYFQEDYQPDCSSIVAAPFLTGEVVDSFGNHGARNYMKIKDEEVFVGIPAELLPSIVENLRKMKG